MITSVDIHSLNLAKIKPTTFLHASCTLSVKSTKAMNALIIPISSAKHKSEMPFTSAQTAFYFYTPDFTPSVKGQDKDF